MISWKIYVLFGLSAIGIVYLLIIITNVINFLLAKRTVSQMIDDGELLIADIEPCPICGSYYIDLFEVYEDDKQEGDVIGYTCKCSYCKLSSPVFESTKAALEYWNTRNGVSKTEWEKELDNQYVE